MMNPRLRVWALAALMFTFGVVFSHAADKKASAKTLTGTVTDSICGAKHMMPGTSAADCTRACVKQGSSYALVVGKEVYTLKGDKDQLNKLAGEQVKVTGTVTGNTIEATSIEPAK